MRVPTSSGSCRKIAVCCSSDKGKGKRGKGKGRAAASRISHTFTFHLSPFTFRLMYQPSHFKEERPDVIRSLIADHPLGAFVTLGQGGIEGNHMPFLYDPDPAPLGTLRCHVARANPVWREFKPEVEALVMFQGPQLYVSPSWYPAKKEHGKVVPTWNYLVA